MHVIDAIRQLLAQYGYWAVAMFLLLENSGVPVPGETILILASAASYGSRELRLPWIIVVGAIAATAGDNIGYWIGRKGGRALLERWKNFFRISRESIDAGEALLAKHGAFAIFFARFVAGARIFAGPLAGILKMNWPRFALANFLGAVVWVSVIATLGHLFGSQLDRLLYYMGRLNWITLVLLAAVALFFLWRKRRRRR
jgi:membrane protein DedA with SNARE-associated domain